MSVCLAAYFLQATTNWTTDSFLIVYEFMHDFSYNNMHEFKQYRSQVETTFWSQWCVARRYFQDNPQLCTFRFHIFICISKECFTDFGAMCMTSKYLDVCDLFDDRNALLTWLFFVMVMLSDLMWFPWICSEYSWFCEKFKAYFVHTFRLKRTFVCNFHCTSSQ